MSEEDWISIILIDSRESKIINLIKQTENLIVTMKEIFDHKIIKATKDEVIVLKNGRTKNGIRKCYYIVNNMDTSDFKILKLKFSIIDKNIFCESKCIHILERKTYPDLVSSVFSKRNEFQKLKTFNFLKKLFYDQNNNNILNDECTTASHIIIEDDRELNNNTIDKQRAWLEAVNTAKNFSKDKMKYVPNFNVFENIIFSFQQNGYIIEYRSGNSDTLYYLDFLRNKTIEKKEFFNDNNFTKLSYNRLNKFNSFKKTEGLINNNNEYLAFLICSGCQKKQALSVCEKYENFKLFIENFKKSKFDCNLLLERNVKGIGKVTSTNVHNFLINLGLIDRIVNNNKKQKHITKLFIKKKKKNNNNNLIVDNSKNLKRKNSNMFKKVNKNKKQKKNHNKSNDVIIIK